MVLKKNKKKLFNLKGLKVSIKRFILPLIRVLSLILFLSSIIYLLLQIPNTRYFKVKYIIIKEGNRVSKEEILNLAKIEMEKSIFLINIRSVGQRLERHPWIEWVNVRRNFPDKIYIDFSERVPFAIINLNNLYYIDRDVRIFKEVNSEDSVNFPVITGINIEDLESNNPLILKMIRKSLYFIDVANRMKFLPNVSEININQESGLKIYTVYDNYEIRFGQDNFMEKIERLSRVITDLSLRSKKALYIDLDYKDRAVVKLSRLENSKKLDKNLLNTKGR